jgi:hypothetical protein
MIKKNDLMRSKDTSGTINLTKKRELKMETRELTKAEEEYLKQYKDEQNARLVRRDNELKKFSSNP